MQDVCVLALKNNQNKTEIPRGGVYGFSVLRLGGDFGKNRTFHKVIIIPGP